MGKIFLIFLWPRTVIVVFVMSKLARNLTLKVAQILVKVTSFLKVPWEYLFLHALLFVFSASSGICTARKLPFFDQLQTTWPLVKGWIAHGTTVVEEYIYRAKGHFYTSCSRLYSVAAWPTAKHWHDHFELTVLNLFSIKSCCDKSLLWSPPSFSSRLFISWLIFSRMPSTSSPCNLSALKKKEVVCSR